MKSQPRQTWQEVFLEKLTIDIVKSGPRLHKIHCLRLHREARGGMRNLKRRKVRPHPSAHPLKPDDKTRTPSPLSLFFIPWFRRGKRSHKGNWDVNQLSSLSKPFKRLCLPILDHSCNSFVTFFKICILASFSIKKKKKRISYFIS